MRKRISCLVVAAACAGLGGAVRDAGAAAYMLAAPISITATNNAGSGVLGTINMVTDISGTSICLSGTCLDTTTRDWLLFTVTLSAGSAPVDEIGIGVPGVSSLGGVGYYTDPDESPTGGSHTATLGKLSYDYLVTSGLNLQAGETTDRLFAVFALGALPGPGVPFLSIPPGTASFMISSGADFSVTGAIALVPEPATAVLLGMGLLGMAIAGRRRG